MIGTIAISVFTLGLGSLITYVIAKRLTNIDRILNISDVLLDEITQNTEMQKKVYILGVLLGNGIKQGIGLPKGKGKFKMDDLIGMAISHFLGGGQQKTTEQPFQNVFKQEPL